MDELIRRPSYYSKGERSRIVRIDRDHPYYRTSNKGSISEPRLVMATHLGRNLTKDDIVYHKNGDYNDNEIANLIVLTKREYHNIQSCARLERARDRIISKIAVYKQHITDCGIDPDTLTREINTDRCREVDRDKEAHDRSRHRSDDD